MPQTPLGLTYPDSDGHTRLWEHLQTLADDTNDLVEETIESQQVASWVQAGKIAVSFSGEVFKDATITYPVAFAATPITVVVTRGTTAAAFATLKWGETASQCVVTVRKYDGTPLSGTVEVFYIAVGPRA
jgi:hypothetical protein